MVHWEMQAVRLGDDNYIGRSVLRWFHPVIDTAGRRLKMEREIQKTHGI
jgi:hypothetical protein